ncbi:MAG TPA: response regulator transcription factor [Cytophagaceae bacterium]
MRILVIEDEYKVAEFIVEGLKMANYKVDLASDGQQGYEMALVNNYNVILMDYMLPKLNGLQLLQELRRHNCRSRVIMLTAKDDVEDKVECLNYGADDYIVKPFSFKELLARIRVVLRRDGQEVDACLVFEDLRFNLLTLEVYRGDKKLELTAQELSLLEYFMRNQNSLITRMQLLEHVWADDQYGDSNKIEVYIYYLRQKIDKGFNKKLLHTIRGKGYILRNDD